jgi:hypothetical protein
MPVNGEFEIYAFLLQVPQLGDDVDHNLKRKGLLL